MRETPHTSRGHDSISEELYQTTGNPNDIDSMVSRLGMQIRMDSAEGTPEARLRSQQGWNKVVRALKALESQDKARYSQALAKHNPKLLKIKQMLDGMTGAPSPGSAAPAKAAAPHGAMDPRVDKETMQDAEYKRGTTLNFKNWLSAAK